MAPLTSPTFSQPSSSHPYSSAQAAQDPKLAGLKVVPPAVTRSPSLLESPTSFPPGPTADPQQILLNVAKGLESLIDRGTIDARPSRQGVAAPRVGACAACREAKVRLKFQYGAAATLTADSPLIRVAGQMLTRGDMHEVYPEQHTLHLPVVREAREEADTHPVRCDRHSPLSPRAARLPISAQLEFCPNPRFDQPANQHRAQLQKHDPA